MYNLLSLMLGLLSWGLGIAAVCKKGRSIYGFGSMALCGVSLVLQLLELSRRAKLSDFSAIQDTAPTVAHAAVLLLIVTVILNGIALLRGRSIGKCVTHFGW